MRKIKLVSILLLIMVLFSSCSNNSTSDNNKNKIPIERKKATYNDEIKFYNFKWLTEANDVLKKFNEDFGEDTYTVNVVEKKIEDTSLVEYLYYLNGKDKKSLNWKIADNNVIEIVLTFVANEDSELRYLTSGTLEFSNDEDVIADVNSKLKKLYTYDKDFNIYRDINGNRILPILGTFRYSCGEVSDIINDIQSKTKQQKRYEEKQKEKEERKDQGL